MKRKKLSFIKLLRLVKSLIVFYRDHDNIVFIGKNNLDWYVQEGQYPVNGRYAQVSVYYDIDKEYLEHFLAQTSK